MRWLALALTLAGCSCEDEPELAADGYVRCHLAEPPEGERAAGDLRLRFEERTLTVEGITDDPRVAVAAGPPGGAVPEADVLVVLGDAGDVAPDGDALVLVIAGGTDGVGGISDDARVVDATPLRLIRLGSLELVPVGGAPARYAATDESCGIGSGDVEAWDLDPPADGVTRVLLSWAAPEASGLLGVAAGSSAIADIRERAHAGAVVFAWPRLDPRAVRPATGAWIDRSDGSREPPGWTTFEVAGGAWTRLD